ncbi:MAG: hypothetical protein ABSA39_08725 [Edaphobacter sp.]
MVKTSLFSTNSQYPKNDDQSLYFQALGMQSGGSRDKQKLTAQGAAELFWELFIHQLQ